MRFMTGLDVVAREPRSVSTWGDFGLLSNQASVTAKLEPAWEVLFRLGNGRLKSLFGPQHGFAGTEQYNMRETGHTRHLATGLPVYSLYSETRKPSPEMLQGIETLVIDLQISGCRIYTWKATMKACLEAAREEGKKVVVLDRPNPLGGEYLEGRTCDAEMMSFVGVLDAPMRHGLTTAELALYMNRTISAELEVVKLQEWNPSLLWNELGRNWVLTSPMLPTDTSVYVYPGTVLFEGTNFSEGRGTTLPFQFIGADYIADPRPLIEMLQPAANECGMHLTAAAFVPTFDKCLGKGCNGIHIHVLDPRAVRSYLFSVKVIEAFRKVGGSAFRWTEPGYEYDYTNLPINLLIGAKGADRRIEQGVDSSDPFWRAGIDRYIEATKGVLLYERDLRDVTL